MKPALLIVDMQKACFKVNPNAVQSLNEAMEYINSTIALFREKALPIICIHHVSEEMDLVPGREDFGVPDELAVLPSDLHIHKKYGNAFNRTSLAEELGKLGVDTVIVTGYCAEFCVLSTYRAAQDNDLTAIILRGALASDSRENIRFVESISELITFRALRKMLG
jgi:nicotinamidase-related amidase